MTLFYSMAAFALAASITPGPVNVVALGSGARYGLMPSLRHVTGATVGFVALLIAVGFGVYELLQRMPILMHAIQWFGVAFLTWYALQSARRAWTATGGLAAARDVVLITDTDPENPSDIRRKLRPRGFSLVMMDKDWKSPIRRPSPRAAREIINTIDKMPITRTEALEKNPAGR